MKNILKFLIFFLISVFLCSCSGKIKNLKENQTKQENFFTCEYKGRIRKFCLYLPKQQDYSKTKLIVALHGYGSSAEDFSQQIKFQEEALPLNYGVLYISGVPLPEVKTSSAGWNYNYDPSGKSDIGFIVDLTREIQKQYKLSKKTAVVGYSNGGFMITKLAVEYPEVFEASVSVCGMMPKPVWEHFKNKPSRFFQINGTKDNVVPMRLNDSSKFNPNPAMEDVIERFSKLHKISDFETEKINENILLAKYENKVWWMLLEEYPHSWPSQEICRININDYILNFLEAEKN